MKTGFRKLLALLLRWRTASIMKHSPHTQMHEISQLRSTNMRIIRERDQLQHTFDQKMYEISLLRTTKLRIIRERDQLQHTCDQQKYEISQLRSTNMCTIWERAQLQHTCDLLKSESLAIREAGLEFTVPTSICEVLKVKPSAQLFGNKREHFFREAESQFLRQVESPQLLGRKVKLVEVLFNGTLWKRYRDRRRVHRDRCEERWGFHGTSEQALQTIVSSGFEVGGEGVPILNGAVGGRGIYIATSPDLSAGFARGDKMIMVQFYLAGAKQHRDAWVVACKLDVLPRYVIHY
eukprot:TRINITY_DN11922_c0_g1_i1.p1 TRINITY_DN11922_c0_g1~~TRINITY_DN11922_c0_g1_i1.p1  ORF type:complete len:317 (+),score=22.65 TRINITY_DN11922_c0_g1_i1:74-952(+)